MHGWPGSVREFYEMIPLLATPRPGQDFVFEVKQNLFVQQDFGAGW